MTRFAFSDYKIMMFFYRPLRLFLLGTLLSLPGLFATPASAQKYRTAAGLRLGAGNYGLTVQQLILPRTTLEGIALLGSREVSATLLAEQHFGLLGRSLNVYAGAGGHVGNHKDNGGFGGVDGILGVEYKTAFIPLVLSLDVKPSFEINNDDWFRFPTAFSVRYILIKEKKTSLVDRFFGGDDKKKKQKQKAKNGQSRGLFDFLD